MTILDRILESTRARVSSLPVPTDDAIRSAPVVRGFRAALQKDGVAVIAEIKRASPSKGPIAPDADAGAIARAYADGGAAAVSVLTEPEFFQGSLADLAAARAAGLPLLMKDFVIDPVQVDLGRVAGADAVLIIVRILGDELASLLRRVEALGMEALVEVFDEIDVERAAAAGARLIGVNHRDLETFELDIDRTKRLAPLIPSGSVLVALSGIESRADVAAMGALGADAVLVGESLMAGADPASRVAALAR